MIDTVSSLHDKESASKLESGARGDRHSDRRLRKFSKSRRKMLRACEALLGEEVVDVAYPGGKSRDAVSLSLADGRRVIASVRENRYRAKLEHRVLVALSERGTPVPGVLAFDGDKLILQEQLPGRRLSQALHPATPEESEQLLGSALGGLAAAQQAGTDAGLEGALPALGVGKDWINDLLRRPLVIGGYLRHRPARPRIDALRTLFKVRQPRFIKWDARPGNAMVEAGKVSWFDWEHSGTRNRLDDVAWLLCDEFTPDFPEIELRLLEHHLTDFADELSLDQAHAYLRAYGVFHSVVRLGLILSLKKDEPWWDFDYCVDRDKVGVTLDCALRICRRAARWAELETTTRPLGVWFGRVAETLEKL